ncbi:hypothetical protein ABT369_11625 [Dactylosporangium sp. NPDC000244]|uniref:hypothetical protein n=1 Tax=Dactylosporangium sp. NPDC000244 TaxID=3154365 RepID=UPI0033278B21
MRDLVTRALGTRAARRRVASAFAAAAAALGLLALGTGGPAKADTSSDQITGNGITDSAVTVRWDAGLLGLDNKTPVKTRDSADPYAFMHADFKDLEVTVGQTENLVHQAIKVTWKGKPMKGLFNANYLQIMECHGDDPAGPAPENCQFGSEGLKQDKTGGSYIGTRNGNVCDKHQPSTAEPPAAPGLAAFLGCDPAEDPAAPGYSHHNPAGGTDTYTVPFVPVNTTDKIYQPGEWPFNKYNSNEIQQAGTRADGTGDAYFNTLTQTEAPGLGCGEIKSDGKPRDCWLVIVPRGEYEPNGWKLQDFDAASIIQESPLGAASWAQRMQIRLKYSPVEPSCALGSAKERQTQGTELVSHAVFSWQLALNTAAKCSKLYGYSATPEASNTSELTHTTSETGLAFTTVPIGTEAVRGGGTQPTLPPLAYAPVAVSAITFGFHVNLADGYVSTPVKLSPRLVAKALTQSYKSDLTDVRDNGGAGPEWARQNPAFMTSDPEFMKLNPGLPFRSGSSLMAPLLTADHSGVIQQVWAWVLTDPAARAWLGGQRDENGMIVNELYQKLDLGSSPLDSFPRPNKCFNTGAPGEKIPDRCTLNLLPYMENYDDSASRVRAANNPEGADWNPNLRSPSGEAGWWEVNQPIEFPGQIFMWGVMDTASLANYGVVPAELCKSDGTGCVSPTTASLTTALGSAKEDSSGLLHVDPANAGSGGYPLTTVTYAAVRRNQDAAALSDYAALIKYAVSDGQRPGVEPGQLPHGFLPLPESLRGTAMAVADLLLTPVITASATESEGPGTGGSGTGGNGSGGVPETGARPVASSSASSAAPFATTSVSPQPAALSTPALEVGAVRWALLAVMIAGLSGAVGGPLLRFALSRRPPGAGG